MSDITDAELDEIVDGDETETETVNVDSPAVGFIDGNLNNPVHVLGADSGTPGNVLVAHFARVESLPAERVFDTEAPDTEGE
jgi:hypothetical protein